MKLKIVPYKMNSDSAIMLQKVLSDKVGYYVYRGKEVPDRKCIFWGRKPDKIKNFELMQAAGVQTVPFTTSKDEASAWLAAGSVVIARTPGGQKGINIQVVKPGEELPDKPLYTRFVKNFTEFRVNVAYDKAIHVSQKRRVEGKPINEFIRSAEGGWEYRKPLFIPTGIGDLAVESSRAVGLPLSGVDIIYNKFYNKLYVLEVNSAPWLNETIAGKYADEIISQL